MNINVDKDRLLFITNQHGIHFGFADPELWMYVGVPERPAFWIAKGFPEYWSSTMGGSDGRFPAVLAEPLAMLTRLEVLRELGQVSMPIAPFIDLADFVPEPKDLDGCPSDYRAVQEWERQGGIGPLPQTRRTNNPFEILLIRCTLSQEKLRDDPVGFVSWKNAAGMLFRELLKQPVHEDAIRKRFRLRDRLSDGAYFLRGRRCSEQQHLEQVFCTSKHRVQWGPLGYDSPSRA